MDVDFSNIGRKTPPAGSRRKRQRGSSVVELTLFGPLFLFFFMGALDWGFSAYALITLQSAARTAALYTSSSSSTAADSTSACTLVLAEMRDLPNIGSAVTTCAGSNLTVTASSVTGPDSSAASQVVVTYTSVPVIPIPGLISRQFTLTRTLTMRIRG